MAKCLVCYQDTIDLEYHPHCSLWLFGSKTPIVLDYALSDMKELAKKAIASQTNITGAQAKISLGKLKRKGKTERLTVDIEGSFILKPPTEAFPQMPEVEALTMQMANMTKINTVPHGLVRLTSGELAYLTRRIDRHNGNKIHQEDLCQLSERSSDDKYKSSTERVGKVIKKYVSQPGLAINDYFTLVVFSFLTGNNDMHMKNYSLVRNANGIFLSPAYDLLNIELIYADDKEESALFINGKKSKLEQTDFEALAENLGLTEIQRTNVYKQLTNNIGNLFQLIDLSFLNKESKMEYKRLLEYRTSKILV